MKTKIAWPHTIRFLFVQINDFQTLLFFQAQEMTACEEREKEDEEAKEAALRAAYGPVPPGPGRKE